MAQLIIVLFLLIEQRKIEYSLSCANVFSSCHGDKMIMMVQLYISLKCSEDDKIINIIRSSRGAVYQKQTPPAE